MVDKEGMNDMDFLKRQRKAYDTDITDAQWKEIEPLYTGMRKRIWSNKISQNIVSNALDRPGCSKQKNQKLEQLGEQHPDRDAQFKHINETGAKYISDGAPFISVAINEQI